MERLIFIQNAWRISDNEMLGDLDSNKVNSNILIGNIDLSNKDIVNGYSRRSAGYNYFSCISAFELKEKLLDKFNVNLELYNEYPLDLLLNLLNKNPSISILRIEEPVAIYEQNIIDVISQKYPNLKIEKIWNNSLYHYHELDLDNSYFKMSFTKFRKKIESKNIKIKPNNLLLKSKKFSNNLISSFKSINKPSSQKLIFTPGERAALERVDYYINQSKLILSYKETRNELLGRDFSSKFSPWLAHGAISPRVIYQKISEFESNFEQNESTYWLKFELLWREFFRHSMRVQKKEFFLLGGMQGKKLPINHNQNKFLKWTQGNTENDFINANLIELNQTGYMSNRGRQNAASYLINDYGCDWRLGASYFESKLIDYDVASNWGNWAYLAGVGHDPRNRIFNVTKQQQVYDPESKYISYWLSKE